MSMKRFLLSSLLAALIFIAGAMVGKYILSPPVEIMVLDVDALSTLIEKYNDQADKIREEFKAMKEWNENALVDPPSFLPEKEEVK